MSRRSRIGSLVVVFATLALVCSSCAGADQQGSAAHRMSVWVNGTGFGEDIGTLVADNARIAKVAPNGSGALHAACSTMINDAEMANSSLPSPDPTVTDLLTRAYGLEGAAGNACYNGDSDQQQLVAGERDGIKADALYDEVLQRIRAIDGRTPVTTTTSGNSGNSGIGSIFG